MATGFVRALSAAGAGAVSSLGLPLTATPAPGGLVVAPMRALGSTADVTSPPTDTKGNTWQFAKSPNAGHRAALAWTTQDVAPLVTTTDTVTVTQTTANGLNARLYEFLPCRPTADSSGTNTAASSTTMIIPSASFTPNLANDIILSVLTHTAGTASGHTIDSGFTIIDAAVVSRCLASLVTSAVANRQATWSWTTTQQSAGVAVAFQLLPPAPASVTGQAVARAAFW